MSPSMPEAGPAPIMRIQSISRVMIWLTTFGLALTLAAVVYVLTDADVLTGLLQDEVLTSEANVALTPWSRAVLTALILVHAVFGAAILWGVRRLFRAFADGRIFATASAASLRTIGLLMIAYAPAGVVIEAIASVVATIGNPAGQRQLTIGLEGADLQLVLMGGLLLVIGWVMGEAVGMSEELEQIV